MLGEIVASGEGCGRVEVGPQAHYESNMLKGKSGLSMDYEVFMLSRIREAYDETGSTEKAIELGLARTGKLVTSGALILMFAFLVLSTSPGYEVKPLAIGVGAGIILDATVIRALLVPAFMRLMGDWNWWMPSWTHAVLRVPRQEPSAQIAAEAA